MPLILTATARTRDWRALRRRVAEGIEPAARAAGAARLALYRNSGDASCFLLSAEFPDLEAADEFCRAADEALTGLLDGEGLEEQAWEAVEADASLRPTDRAPPHA